MHLCAVQRIRQVSVKWHRITSTAIRAAECIGINQNLRNIGERRLNRICTMPHNSFTLHPSAYELINFRFFSRANLQQDCPNGRLTPAKFVDMYKMFFPSGNAEEFCDHVFRTFDMDKNGYIDFKVRFFSQYFYTLLNSHSNRSINEESPMENVLVL